MEIRKIPFGYEISDGAVQINTKESDCVLWIFTMYNMGASLGVFGSGETNLVVSGDNDQK